MTDLLRNLRPPRTCGFEVRFETPPGKQAQVDFAQFVVEFTDESRFAAGPACLSRVGVSWCYPAAHFLGGVKSWHRTNTIKAARRVAIPIRRGAGKGYPLVWRASRSRLTCGAGRVDASV